MKTWIQTYSGLAFDPVNPDINLINIVDIAHSLSLLCRFGGHSLKFYSVAEHSMLVSQLCPPEYALVGLLHDAAEAYIGDIVKPLKASLAVDGIEKYLDELIAQKFGLPYPWPKIVKDIDYRLLGNERIECMASGPTWHYVGRPFNGGIRFMFYGPKLAERPFLDRFKALYNV